MTIRRYNIGKFDTPMDEHVYAQSLDGPDETAGTVQDIGWHGFMRAPLYDASSEFKLNEEEVKYLKSMVGAIIVENSMGFVSVEYYDDIDSMVKRWGEIQEEEIKHGSDGPT